MDKEKILKKARKENRDDREHQIKIKSFYAGWLGVAIMIMILNFMQYSFKDFSLLSDVLVIISANLLAMSIYQYKRLKSVDQLFGVIISLISLGLAFSALLSGYGVY